GVATAGNQFFPATAANARPAVAESGLSRLMGLPGFWSRNPGIKFVAAAAVVVLLLGLAVFVLVRPAETKLALAPATETKPVSQFDPEKRARLEAEKLFKMTVGGSAPV